jgi:hypothetical protein
VSWLGWRLVQMAGAFFVALLLPAMLLVVVNGLVRTGMAGMVAFAAWIVAMVLLVRLVRSRSRVG